MTYYLGQRVTVSTTVTDADGQPAAATVACTVTAPDGTSSTPSVDTPSLGVYETQVTLDQAGDWLVVWAATGAVVTTNVDQLHVITPSLRIVSLAEVKDHANITTSQHDRELLDFIGTAQQMIDRLVGVTVPATITAEVHPAGQAAIWLHRLPILTVSSVAEYTGDTLTASLGVGDYDLDPASGRLARTNTAGAALRYAGTQVRVTYRAGRQPIPETIRWAGKELTAHLWRRSQPLRGGRGRADIDAAPVGLGYAMPNAVAEALAPYLLTPMVA